MRTNPLFLLAIAVFSMWTTAVAAQDTSKQVRLLGIYAQGKALLRWAPTDYPSWQRGTKQGYRLERYTLQSNGGSLSNAQVLASRVVLSARLLPLSASIFEQMSDTSNAAGVAGAALYEDSVQVTVNTGDP
ncbi:hypothetical protein, partial [Haliscomenobacter sp.]|uniref:hypothetical protein n=1 Tax=Haliscomenobacter sp. TaxID=2717303 RepID=UPI003364D06A